MSFTENILCAAITIALSAASHVRRQWVVANMRQSLGLPGVQAGPAVRQELQARLQSATAVLFAGQGDPALLAALQGAFPALCHALILDWSPEPERDRYAMLVNADQVALVDIARAQIGPAPAPSLQVIGLQQYLARGMSGNARRLVAAARELMGERRRP